MGEIILPVRRVSTSDTGETRLDEFTFEAASWNLVVHEGRPGHELQLGRITTEAAFDLLTRDVVVSPALAEQEEERYTTRMPGQATSYFCGYSRYLELRMEAEMLLGEHFDRRTFNDLVLSQGLLPPSLMKRYVLAELPP
jgi:uncharacterized protein (DUF885 family)